MATPRWGRAGRGLAGARGRCGLLRGRWSCRPLGCAARGCSEAARRGPGVSSTACGCASSAGGGLPLLVFTITSDQHRCCIPHYCRSCPCDRHDLYLPSIPDSLQTLGRCECVAACSLFPLGLRIISPLTFYLSFLGAIWTYDKNLALIFPSHIYI